MWTVVYMTQDKDNALQIREILEKDDILVKMRSLKKSEADYCYELLVPETEMCRAHGNILEAEL